MANKEQVDILLKGTGVWNEWKGKHRDVEVNLIGAKLNFARLNFADLNGVRLNGARLNGARLNGARLSDAKLNHADLSRADLNRADLNRAYLMGANLSGANLSGAILDSADLSYSLFGATILADLDLSKVLGLASVRHYNPSSVGIDTLYKSGGSIPEPFLRGCGVPDDFITFIPSHFSIKQAIQFYSCFISYSTKDEEFARRLHSRMRDEHLRVWFAPEDIKGGMKIYEQIERAIQVQDRLLLVLSENSIKSNWVINEIREARRIEVKENRRKLFPIGLSDYMTLKEWKYIDSTGEDLAEEIKQYYIPDFSDWKNHDAFEKGFAKLLRDLRAEESKG